MAGISYVLPALFFLFLLVAANRVAPARRVKPLSQGELLTVFVMLSAGLTIGGPGGMQHLVVALASIQWYAGPRRWEWARPFLPSWLFPEPEALRGFFRGEAPAVPWQAWLLPGIAWGVFTLVLVFVMLCLASLLRRQWTDHERLTYPLVALPLAMTRDGGELLFARSRLFWTAALLTLAIESLNSLSYLYPAVPSLPVKPVELHSYATERPWSAIGYFCVAFYPLVLGIGYLISLEILFSYAFFYLLTKAQLVGSAALGWSDSGSQQLPYLAEQGAGAWIALALAALWMARRQLAQAVRRACASGRDDPGEPAPYRTALLGVVGGLLFLGLFCRAAGMSFAVAIGVLGIYLLFALAAARIRAEAGTAWLFSPATNPPALLVAGMGTEQLGVSNLVGLAWLQWFMLNTESVAMPYHLEGFRLGDGARVQRPGLFRAMLLASVVGISAAFWALLSLYYHYGAATAKVNDWRTAMGSVPWERLTAWVQGPHGVIVDLLAELAIRLELVRPLLQDVQGIDHHGRDRLDARIAAGAGKPGGPAALRGPVDQEAGDRRKPGFAAERLDRVHRLQYRLCHGEVKRPRLFASLHVLQPGMDNKAVFRLSAEEGLVGDIVQDSVDGAGVLRHPDPLLRVGRAAAAAGVVESAEFRMR